MYSTITRNNFSVLFILSLLVIFTNTLFGQQKTVSYKIPELQLKQYEQNDNQIFIISFEGSFGSHNFYQLPAVMEKFEVDKLFASYQISIQNVVTEPINGNISSKIPAHFSQTELQITIQTATENNQHFAMLSFIPILKNENGTFSKINSVSVTFEGREPIQPIRPASVSQSVLATGSWYKISVPKSGLYKVTYSDLQTLGVPVSNLQSARISLFGNGGAMINEINPVTQIDDLIENPISIYDGGDGNFGTNDYFVFYAQGPHSNEFNASTKKFSHTYNIYSDNAFYFINVDAGIGGKKRLETKSFSHLTESATINTFTFFDFYENDKMNFGESGKAWFDEPIYGGNTKTYNFTLPELSDSYINMNIKTAVTSKSSTSLTVTWHGNARTVSLAGAYSSSFALTAESPISGTANSGSCPIELTYNNSQSSTAMHLDFIEVQAKCNLKFNGSILPFAITDNLGTSKSSLIQLSNANSQTVVWDVTSHTEPYRVEGNLNGSQFSFKTPTDKKREFVAFNSSTFNSVICVGKVANQNLHGFQNVNMVIISHPNFITEAERLAKFRSENDQLVVKVVTPEQVYHEFSSGGQDISGIRNFMRFMRDKDPQNFKFLLLFGRPTYDYRGRVEGTKMFVPNFQMNTDLEETSFRSNDDYFALLDAYEGNFLNNMLDINVGRFPVSTLAQAKIGVDKTINASIRKNLLSENATQISNFGDWRISMAFVADDGDGNDHLDDAENAAKIIANNDPLFNLDKIYCDAYKQISNAGGQRYPDANKAIALRMESGALAFSYFGHGGGNGLAHERIIEISDINGYSNTYNQPLYITITCSFGWYDRKATSPAELLFLNPKGGASSLYTTSRVSYSNNPYGRAVFQNITRRVNNKPLTIGELNRIAKNASNGTTGSNNMIYVIGDPSTFVNLPRQNIVTETILDDELNPIDTIKALSKVTVKGRVTDWQGATLSNFNGNIYPSIFDKPVKQKTLGNDTNSDIIEFTVQKNRLFRGNATVTNGLFEFSFYVPKDINYEFGFGKLSYYAASTNDDAAGYKNDFIVGGMSDKPIDDQNGPEISLYLNDEKFVPGGITNTEPTLILKLKDEYGINATGNGIGHDLVAILDNNIEKQIILNDYYVANKDSYNAGIVRYPLKDLAPGNHTIKVRAWDITNNPSEATIDFLVKSEEKLLLDHVLNYPNPFTTRTSFFFEHNQPTETFDISIHIFTISGKLVKTIFDNQFLEGFRSKPIVWDGRDEYGDKIGKGVYIYKLTVRNSLGETAEKIEKVAIL